MMIGVSEERVDKYFVSDDKRLLQMERVKAMLEKTYWARNRTEEIIKRSIENSLTYGVYYKNEQVGFARVITDYATTFYLCDVVIDEGHRGMGLGKKLIETIVEDKELTNLRGILATRDAHGLYRQYGFASSGEWFMHRAQGIKMIDLCEEYPAENFANKSCSVHKGEGHQ
jgi:GNAT superfamily N-acetyltransferase